MCVCVCVCVCVCHIQTFETSAVTAAEEKMSLSKKIDALKAEIQSGDDQVCVCVCVRACV